MIKFKINDKGKNRLSLSYSFILVISFLLFVLFGSNIKAQTIIPANYYFDAENGNDSNNGTAPATAWKTAGKFNSTTFPAGSVIALRDSMEYQGYFELTEDGTSGSLITVTNWFGSSTGQRPLILGAGATEIIGWTQTVGYSNVWQANIKGKLSVWFEFADSTRWGGWKSGLTSLTDEFDCYYSNGVLYAYSPSDPSTRYSKVLYDYGDEQSLSASCFTLSGARYVKIENLEMKYTRGKGLKFMNGSDFSEAENIKVSYCGKSFTFDVLSDGGDGIYVSSSNVTVSNCTMYENAGHGGYVWGNSFNTISNIVWDGCVSYNNHHTAGIDVNSSSGQIRNVTIKNSLIYTTVNTWFANALEYNAGKGAMGMFVKGETAGLVKGVTYYNNIIANTIAVGIQTDANSDSTKIIGNTFIELDNAGLGSGGTAWNWCIYSSSQTAGSNEVRNNIFYVRQSPPTNYIVRAYQSAILQTNLAYREDGSSYLIYGTSLSPPYNQNPLFIDVNNGNYQLQSNSPAIDIGTDLGSLYSVDRLGVTRPQDGNNSSTAEFDIGAYEYFSGGNVDITPPELVSARISNETNLILNFSEPLNSTIGQNINNYSINNGINVTGASISGSVVILTTTKHTVGSYTVTASNISDLAGNVIGANKYSSYEWNGAPDIFLLPIANAFASAIPEPEHNPEMAIDGRGVSSGDPDTRWAGDTMPEWIAFDFGTTQILQKTRFEFYNWNNGRIYIFSVQVSQDNINWTTVLDQATSLTQQWTENEFTPVQTRYVKVTFISSNQNDWAGLWEVELWGTGTTGTNQESKLPNTFVLEQNYPNPFNPSTKIRYNIPSMVSGQMSNVVLKVYDILGNEVATLVNENQLEGSYEVEFKAENLASGVYVYRIQTTDLSASSGQAFTETKKMILLR